MIESQRDELVKDFRNYLLYLKRLGYEGAPEYQDKRPSKKVATRPNLKENLDIIHKEVENCSQCKLGEGIRDVVFGAGRQDAKLVIIGDRPGPDSNQQGFSFEHEAEELLTRMLKAIDLTRQDVYVCNIVKCRPPHSSTISPNETAACIHFLHRQLRAIRPQLICTLGDTAANALLNTNLPITQLRGKFHPFGEARLLATFHPVDLLKHPEKKKEAWADLQKLLKAYETA